VRNVFKDLRAKGLAVDVKDSEAIDVDPEHVPAPYRAPLLCLEARSFADVGHDPGPFFFALFSFSAVPVVYWCIAVVSRVILCLGAWEGERLLNADYVHLFCKGKVESCDVAGCALACICPADLEVSVSELFVAAVATVLCLAS
jgi:hypothetical protein